MRKLLFLSLICVSFLSSCKKESNDGPMLLETREIDFRDLTADEIKAQPIGLEVPGIVHLAIQVPNCCFLTTTAITRAVSK